MKSNLLKVYRLCILLGTTLSLFWFHSRQSARGEAPVSLKEVQFFLPQAATLSFEKKSVHIYDANKSLIAYALRTSPHANHIKGYAGSTDALILIDLSEKIVGVSLRSSQDTPGHVEDVQGDYTYLDGWRGRELSKVAQVKSLEDNEIWGVSGATKTSDCMSYSVIHRSNLYLNEDVEVSLNWQPNELLFVLVLALAILVTFTKLKQNVRYRKALKWLIFLIVVSQGVDLLCLSLVNGWVVNGAPLYSAPIFLAYVIVLFIVPLTTRKQIYCQQICPHGFMQDQIGSLLPSKYHWKISQDFKWLLGFVPFLLIMGAVTILLFGLPYDLADLEVFAAWYPTRASIICLSLFVLSIFFSLFVPKGYCKYACPTGRLLEYSRFKDVGDKFSFRDKVGGILFIVVLDLVTILDIQNSGGGL